MNEISPYERPRDQVDRHERIAARRPNWPGRPWILWVIAAALVAGGLIWSWSWLVAIGAAPVLLALLPCAAMCALGICMRHKRDGACARDADHSEAGPDRIGGDRSR